MPWHWAVLLGIGALGLYQLSRAGAPTPAEEIQAAVNAAIAKENDISILKTFQTKLQNSGLIAQAQAISQKIALLDARQSVATTKTAIQMVNFAPPKLSKTTTTPNPLQKSGGSGVVPGGKIGVL